MTTKEVIAKMISEEKNSCVKNIVVKNVNVTDMDSYMRVGITLTTPVKGYVADPENPGEYKEGLTNVIFVSNYSIVAVLRENEDLAFAGNWLINHKNALNVVLSGATIDVVQEAVAAGEVYTNPFSENGNESIISHDNYFNHVFNIRLSKRGNDAIEKIADRMLFEE